MRRSSNPDGRRRATGGDRRVRYSGASCHVWQTRPFVVDCVGDAHQQHAVGVTLLVADGPWQMFRPRPKPHAWSRALTSWPREWVEGQRARRGLRRVTDGSRRRRGGGLDGVYACRDHGHGEASECAEHHASSHREAPKRRLPAHVGHRELRMPARTLRTPISRALTGDYRSCPDAIVMPYLFHPSSSGVQAMQPRRRPSCQT